MEAVYKTVGEQQAYYLDGEGHKVPGEILLDGTLLYLRNKQCNLLPTLNVFEIAAFDDEDKYYVILDADQVEEV